MQNTVIQGDALEIMRGMADTSFDAIVTDPPYFGVLKEKWDNQWKTRADFLTWIGCLADEWARLLKPNGSLYVFASPGNASGVEEEIRKRFDVLNSIVWDKKGGQGGRASKDAARAFWPGSERIVFAQHYGADGAAKGESGWERKCDELRGFVFEPLRAYLDDERKRAGIDKADCNVACGFSHSAGGMASRHYFSRSQWCLPTAEHYAAMQRLFNKRPGDDYLRREYDYLRREYEDLRREYEDLRRPFNISIDKEWSDVWHFDTTPRSKPGQPRRHPCEKPQALLEHIIRASTRPGAAILDCFGGSGSLAEAAIRLDRVPTLIELDTAWVERARARIENMVPPLFRVAAE